MCFNWSFVSFQALSLCSLLWCGYLESQVNGICSLALANHSSSVQGCLAQCQHSIQKFIILVGCLPIFRISYSIQIFFRILNFIKNYLHYIIHSNLNFGLINLIYSYQITPKLFLKYIFILVLIFIQSFQSIILNLN